MPVAVAARRRQPKRVLGELGGGDRCATGARQSRGVLQDTGDLGVRAFRRKREVTGSVERVRDDEGDASMRAPSLVRGDAVVDHGCEQRVRETNRPVRALDDTGGKGGIEYTLCDVEACEQLGGRTTHGRCEQQGLSGCRRQLVEACAHQSLERLWETERLRGSTSSPRARASSSA